MYETEKALAKVDFVGRFRWNNEDTVLMRSRKSETRNCAFCVTANPPEERVETSRLYDYEDDQSGGFPLCEEHASEFVFETGPSTHDWVTQDPEGAWKGVGSAEGHGWSELWFLFAPEGKYAKGETWPHEGDDDDEDEQFHDGGMRLGTNESGERTWQPDCECGWTGTETTDLDAAFAERDAHEKEDGR